MNQDAHGTLAILAGGQSTRMGFPKAALNVGGQPILRYLLERFAWPGATLLVTAPGCEHPPGHEAFDCEVVDPVVGQGPLRGILTALEHAAMQPVKMPVVVAAVDMLGMESEPLLWLTERLRAHPHAAGIMTERGGELQPLPAIFRTELAECIRRRLEAGERSVRRLASEPHVIVLAAPSSWRQSIWQNVNRPADLDRFIAEMKP